MKKLALFLSFLFNPIFISPVFADSIDPCPSAGPFTALCNLSSGRFGGLVGNVVNFILVLAVIIAVLYLIYGGIKYIMSKGDKTQVEEARNHIVASIVGLIIVFLAFFIINIVLGFFLGKGQGINTLDLPNITNNSCPGVCKAACIAGKEFSSTNPDSIASCSTNPAGKFCCVTQ